MEEEVRKKLKNFDDVLDLLNDMIKNIDDLMEVVDIKQSIQGKPAKGEQGNSVDNPKLDSED